jgi:hypothetical protein
MATTDSPLTADALWRRVLDEATTSSAQATVGGLRPLAYADGVLRLGREQEEGAKGGTSPARRDALGRLVGKVIGRAVSIEIDEPTEPAHTTTKASPMENHPEVRSALKKFDAMVIEVENDPTAARKEQR